MVRRIISRTCECPIAGEAATRTRTDDDGIGMQVSIVLRNLHRIGEGHPMARHGATRHVLDEVPGAVHTACAAVIDAESLLLVLGQPVVVVTDETTTTARRLGMLGAGRGAAVPTILEMVGTPQRLVTQQAGGLRPLSENHATAVVGAEPTTGLAHERWALRDAGGQKVAGARLVAPGTLSVEESTSLDGGSQGHRITGTFVEVRQSGHVLELYQHRLGAHLCSESRVDLLDKQSFAAVMLLLGLPPFLRAFYTSQTFAEVRAQT